MATVYLVTRGGYSDYHIVGVYSTREGAEALVAYYNGPDGAPLGYGDKARIEEAELDAPLPTEYRGFVASGKIRDGVDNLWIRYSEWYHEEGANVHFEIRDNLGESYITVRAETEEKARLLWADIRRAILAGTIVAPPPEDPAHG